MEYEVGITHNTACVIVIFIPVRSVKSTHLHCWKGCVDLSLTGMRITWKRKLPSALYILIPTLPLFLFSASFHQQHIGYDYIYINFFTLSSYVISDCYCTCIPTETCSLLGTPV